MVDLGGSYKCQFCGQVILYGMFHQHAENMPPCSTFPSKLENEERIRYLIREEIQRYMENRDDGK